MPEPEQHEIPFQGRRIKNPRMRRGIFLLPSLFTAANLLCGYYAVVAALVGGHDDFDHAAKAIGLADVFSCGIAPAVLAYAWGVRSLPGLYSGEGHWLSEFGWMACLIFLVCCA